MRARGADLLERAWPLALAASISVWHFSFFDAETRPIVTDVRYFLYYAWRVTEGAVPHLDLFAVKTQLCVFAGALLHALAAWIGVDPLQGVRRGYLAIAALGAVLQFAIFRRLGGGVAAGLLGLAAYASFGLLGELPAIGNVPKLLMAVSASAMALFAQRKCWVAAGIAAALAALDWQVGTLTGLAAVAAAMLFGGASWSERGRAVARVAQGALLAATPIALFYASRGALAATLQQVVFDALARGSAAGRDGVPGPLERIANTVPLVCPEQEWLFVAGTAGMGIAALALWRWQDPEGRRLLVPLAIHHYGVVGFSLLDIQGYGDYMALLHSIAFFLGVTWLAAARVPAWLRLPTWLAAQRVLRIRNERLAARALCGALLIFASVVARPGPWRPPLSLRAPGLRAGATLEDQRRVALALDRLVGDGVLAALDHSELLYLTRRSNPLPVVYFNRAVQRYYGLAGESDAETARRMLLSVAPDAILPPRPLARSGVFAAGFEPLRIASEGDRCWAVVHLAKSGDGAPRPERASEREAH